MPSGMFGAPTGWSQAGKDSDARLMNALSVAEGLGKLEMQPAQKAMTEAHARLYGAEADTKVQQLETRKRISEAMAQLGAGGNVGGDPAEMMEQAGKLHLQAGEFTVGRELLGGAELYRTRAAREQQQKQAAALAQLNTQAKQLETFGGAVSAVTGQADLDRMRMLWTESASGITDPQARQQTLRMLEMIPQDYETAKPVLKQFADQSIRAADKLKLDAQEAALKIREQLAEGRERTNEVVRSLRTAQEDLARERIEALQRAGAKGASKEDRDQALSFVKSQLGLTGKKPTTEGLVMAAGELADNARKLIKTNPAFTLAQAMAQLYKPEDWEVERNTWSADTARYVRGGSARTAIPLPLDSGGRPDMKKTKDAGHYLTPDGKVWQRRGDKMVQVGGG